MKLPFINESIFESHKSQIKIGESFYLYILREFKKLVMTSKMSKIHLI